MKVRRSRTTAWQQPILRRFGVIHVAGAPISGFTRGDLKPTGISGHAPRSYTDLGRPFRERAGERRFGVAPKDRPKPRRFGVIHAGIRRSGVSRRFGVIHQNLRRSGKNPYNHTQVLYTITHTWPRGTYNAGQCTQIYLESSNTPTALRRPRHGSGPSTPGPGFAWASPHERPGVAPRSLAPALVPKEY